MCAGTERDDHTYLCAGGNGSADPFAGKEEISLSVIDLTHIDEIKHITEDEDQVVIGSGVTMTQLEKSTIIKKYFPAPANGGFHGRLYTDTEQGDTGRKYCQRIPECRYGAGTFRSRGKSGGP